MDVSACKGHGRGIANPSVDMTACLERSLRDTASKLEHAGADPGAADAVGEPDLE